ncbi:MAG: succinate dehydrogenase assembly factor 2 [Xanthomonadales bacterium]|nr:succinate dehydrogenase assembly factor 2 [Xanthomonadales bacterium]
MRWRSRRGMQELDTLLNDYLDAYYAGLDEASRDSLELLLDTEDDILWLWLSGQKTCDNTAFSRLIDDIRR